MPAKFHLSRSKDIARRRGGQTWRGGQAWPNTLLYIYIDNDYTVFIFIYLFILFFIIAS